MGRSKITVFLADDNLIVREGVRALLELEEDVKIVGVGSDYQQVIEGAQRSGPQVLVTDIRMPPTFTKEGIEAAKEVRKSHPGMGVVILSQYDDPEYAISLLGEGAAGYAYLLKDRVAEGDQLARAVREVATGGSMLDPKIVEALVTPVRNENDLTSAEEELLRMVAEGKTIKAIAAAKASTPSATARDVDGLFLKLAQGASAGESGALRRLKMLHETIVSLEEQGATLSRLVPSGLADKLRREGHRLGETEKLNVTVVMSDVRGYSSIAEKADPSLLARQLSEHRAEMNTAILNLGGTVMQFVGDAVMAVFGAPLPQQDHADRALSAAHAMHAGQMRVNERWASEGLPEFGLGIGLSTGDVAAALLGSQERLEYSVVGDTVNLTQRIQQWARAGETVLSEATFLALSETVDAEKLEPQEVKGRQNSVVAYRVTTKPPREHPPVPGH